MTESKCPYCGSDYEQHPWLPDTMRCCDVNCRRKQDDVLMKSYLNSEIRKVQQ